MGAGTSGIGLLAVEALLDVDGFDDEEGSAFACALQRLLDERDVAAVGRFNSYI